MDRVTRWWGLAVLVFFLGCGPTGSAPPSPLSTGSPASSGTPTVETAPGATSSPTPQPAESAPATPPQSAPASPATGAPADRPASESSARNPAEAGKQNLSSAAATVPAAGTTAAPPLEQLQSWAAALVSNDVQTREAASEKLDQAVIAGAQPLVPLLQDASPDVRRGTVFYLLDRFDPADVAVVAALTKCLADQDASVRRLALSAAQRFPPEGLVTALPSLITIVSHPQASPDSRAAAARLIGSLEGAARDAIPALLKAATADPDPTVRSAGVLALCRAAPAKDAVAALRQVLRQDSQANLRGLAATRLGKLGQPAGAAAPELAESLADRDDGVRRKAADALVALGPPAVAPTMQKLAASDVAVRRLAVFVLGKLGADAKPALESLRKLQQDSDAEVQQLAQLAVRRIEGAQTPAGNR